MIAIADNLVRNSLKILPERDEPYRLEAVYESFRDGCRLEVDLLVDGGYLQFAAIEEDDSIAFDFHLGEFEPSRAHHSVAELSPIEKKVLQQLTKGQKTKQQLGARAKVLGAWNSEKNGKQGGGLLKRGLVVGKHVGRENQYAITTSGRQALASSVWSRLIGKTCGWTWVAWNQQGYRDSVMLSFDGMTPTVLLCVCASSIEVFSIAG